MTSPRIGKCYQLAGRHMMEMDDDGITGLIIVHGIIGVPEYNNPHAWVQYIDDSWIIERDGIVFMDGTVCWEPITEVAYPVDVFQALFRAQSMHSYTMDEMAKVVGEANHWGPWDGDYWKLEGKKAALA